MMGDPTPCRPWAGPVTHRGFPKDYVDGHYVAPHRAALERELGEPLGGRTVRQLCGDKRCCNPDHLTVVDRSALMLNSDEPFPTNRNSHRRGVYRHGNRWRAQIRHHGVVVVVGVYTTIAEAAEAARQARRRCSAS